MENILSLHAFIANYTFISKHNLNSEQTPGLLFSFPHSVRKLIGFLILIPCIGCKESNATLKFAHKLKL